MYKRLYKRFNKPLSLTRRFFVLLCFTLCITTFFAALFGFSTARQTQAAYAYAFSDVKSGYARVITDDTPFYSDASGKRLLFYLPYTYYVRILENGAFYTHVECYGTGGTAAIDGYVPSDMLFYDGLSVKNPYVDLKLTALSTAVLYSDSELKTPVQYVFAGRTMNYYGTLPLGENSYAYFVGYNDRLGYVKESDVMPFEIENHPNELTFIPKEEPEPETPPAEDPEDNANNSKLVFDLRILIIASLCFAGITAIFVAFRKKPKKHPAAGYYDENDYE